MRRRAVLRRSLAVVALSAWMVTCGDPKSRAPTSPSGASLTSAEINGPSSIAPGQSAQFTATMHLSDGSTKIATASAVQWASSVSSLMAVTPDGVARAGSKTGDVTLTAVVTVPGVGRRTVTRELVILPDGTYRLVGRITDAEFPSIPITSAHLEATPGSASTNTDPTGNYRLYGVAADSEVHINSDGYLPFVQSVHLTGHASQGFQLTPAAPRLNLVGSYTVTIDAAPGCTGPFSLPDDFQHRSYQATMTQNSLTPLVKLTEPRFKLNNLGRGNHFSGAAGIEAVTFTLPIFQNYYYYYYYYDSRDYPNIAEQLPDGTILAVGGSITAKGTAAGLSGSLNGSLTRWDSSFPYGAYLGGCFSQAHQFSLTPR